jgi:hypothetical protein
VIIWIDVKIPKKEETEVIQYKRRMRGCVNNQRKMYLCEGKSMTASSSHTGKHLVLLTNNSHLKKCKCIRNIHC